MTRAITPTLARAARFILGAIFIYVGAQKIIDPVAFLKAVNAYQLVSMPTALNTTAVVLPWLEVTCGALLLLRKKPRASAMLLLAMLLVFTLAVTLRAIAIHQNVGTAFCAIRFDCGCGTGEVPICGKLLENIALIILAAFVAATSSVRREASGTK
jgi:putative oxidoreductase